MKKFFLTGVFIGVLGLALTLGRAGKAFADSSDSTASPLPQVTDAVIIDPAVLQKTTQEYFAAIQTYRGTEEKYLIARAQYYQLNTLAAQDEAIRRAQEVLLARSVVLEKYYGYLRLVLSSTRGLELNDKEVAAAILDDSLRQLTAYREGIRGLDSRNKINQHFVVFNSQKLAFSFAGYSTLALIKIGQLQTAIDTVSILRNDMGKLVEKADISAAERALKLRGLQEVDNVLQVSQANLSHLRDQYRSSLNSGSYLEQSYRQFQGDADSSYTQLRQGYSFLQEVAKNL